MSIYHKSRVWGDSPLQCDSYIIYQWGHHCNICVLNNLNSCCESGRSQNQIVFVLKFPEMTWSQVVSANARWDCIFGSGHKKEDFFSLWVYFTTPTRTPQQASYFENNFWAIWFHYGFCKSHESITNSSHIISFVTSFLNGKTFSENDSISQLQVSRIPAWPSSKKEVIFLPSIFFGLGSCWDKSWASLV